MGLPGSAWSGIGTLRRGQKRCLGHRIAPFLRGILAQIHGANYRWMEPIICSKKSGVSGPKKDAKSKSQKACQTNLERQQRRIVAEWFSLREVHLDPLKLSSRDNGLVDWPTSASSGAAHFVEKNDQKCAMYGANSSL